MLVVDFFKVVHAPFRLLSLMFFLWPVSEYFFSSGGSTPIFRWLFSSPVLYFSRQGFFFGPCYVSLGTF